MTRVKQLVVDSAEPSALARFWAATLDDFEIRAYDKAETTRLIALGASIVQHFDTHTWMRDPEGNDFCLTDA